MKNDFEKRIKKAGAHITLTEAEREKMRALLREYATMKPVREPVAPLPVHATFFDAWVAYVRRPIGIVVVAVLILALSSSGVAYAAEGTLPGDILYPIKVNVIEPVQLALAVSPEAKAALQMTFAGYRIDEAALLANDGKLGTTTEAALAANFTENASGAAIAVAQERMRNPTAADMLSAGFAARLAAYENVLAVVAHSRNKGATEHLQAAIQTQLALIASAQTSGDASSTLPDGIPPQEQSTIADQNVLHLQNAADTALRVSAGIIGAASSTLDASSSADARRELQRASALVEQGRVLLKRHDENGAARAFQDSLSATARLDVLTRAAATLGVQVFATTSASTTSSGALGGSPADARDTVHLPRVLSPEKKGQNLPFGL